MTNLTPFILPSKLYGKYEVLPVTYGIYRHLSNNNRISNQTPLLGGFILTIVNPVNEQTNLPDESMILAVSHSNESNKLVGQLFNIAGDLIDVKYMKPSKNKDKRETEKYINMKIFNDFNLVTSIDQIKGYTVNHLLYNNYYKEFLQTKCNDYEEDAVFTILYSLMSKELSSFSFIQKISRDPFAGIYTIGSIIRPSEEMLKKEKAQSELYYFYHLMEELIDKSYKDSSITPKHIDFCITGLRRIFNKDMEKYGLSHILYDGYDRMVEEKKGNRIKRFFQNRNFV